MFSEPFSFYEHNNSGVTVHEGGQIIEKKVGVGDKFSMAFSKNSFFEGKYEITLKIIQSSAWMGIGFI
jgi:hypothetical protein